MVKYKVDYMGYDGLETTEVVADQFYAQDNCVTFSELEDIGDGYLNQKAVAYFTSVFSIVEVKSE